MLSRRGNYHWYDALLIALAGAIVYPDRVVEWLSRLSGRVLGLGSFILVEVAAIVGMVGAMLMLLPTYPKLVWWHPILYIGALAFARLGMWCVSRFFGFDD